MVDLLAPALLGALPLLPRLDVREAAGADRAVVGIGERGV
jgi:hypothetical protein